MPSTTNKMAACDRHLAKHLRDAVPEKEGRGARIVRVDGDDDRYRCDCKKPADWYVTVHQPEPEPANRRKSAQEWGPWGPEGRPEAPEALR